MATYCVGDIQGCLDPLKRLLDHVNFNPANDQLWAVGDLINRGPQSLETLRFCCGLGDNFRTVLGNHDLHLLAVAHGVRPPNHKDTLNEILSAPDRDELLYWLQQQPLLIHDAGYVLVHAGIPHIWDIEQAKQLATEVETVLKSDLAGEYFSTMYGNEPYLWSDSLTGTTRWRLITNYLTRMRFCTADGTLDLENKSTPDKPPKGFKPWYQHKSRKTADTKIVFGHWAALQGQDCGPNLFPLDTGCVWGGPLRLMDLSTGEYIHSK